MASVSPDDIRAAREAAEAASARYRRLLFAAREAGVPVRHIASAANVTRQRIYALLRERPPEVY